MNGDEFISTKNIHEKNFAEEDNNFFAQSDGRAMRISMPEHSAKHLNDYDSNILKEEANKDVSDEVFKLEYKISKTENEIKELEKHIQTASDLGDYTLANNLNARKYQLETDLRELAEIYNEASISAKISGGVTSKIKNRLNAAQKAVNNIGHFVLSKLPGKLSYFMEIRDSLSKLENINKSVDELMTVQYPYGEAEEKYNRLSKYIARANTIQSEISRFIK